MNTKKTLEIRKEKRKQFVINFIKGFIIILFLLVLITYNLK